MSDDGNVNGELITEPNINAAVVGVAYVSPEAADATGGITVDGFVATATITGGDPDEHRTLDWGDGSPAEEFVLSDSGGQTASHTYAAAGTYTVTGKDSAGNVLTSDSVTITEPPPETPAAYDPGAHTVAEVEAYVAAHPDERAAVLAAEQAGKNRTTLVASLESSE